jgi:hypothetical protein
MRTIQGYALTLATLLTVPYITAPLLKEDFDVSDAPESPPAASIVLSATGDAVEVQFNTVSDEPIEVTRPSVNAAGDDAALDRRARQSPSP